MPSSTSAKGPKLYPSDRLAFRRGTLMSGAHRRRCCKSSLSQASGNSPVNGSGSIGGATSDELEEHVKWAAEWIESSESPTKPHAMLLGQVSRLAAKRLAEGPHASENLILATAVSHVLQCDAGASHLRQSRSPQGEFTPVQSFRAPRQPAAGRPVPPFLVGTSPL